MKTFEVCSLKRMTRPSVGGLSVVMLLATAMVAGLFLVRCNSEVGSRPGTPTLPKPAASTADGSGDPTPKDSSASTRLVPYAALQQIPPQAGKAAAQLQRGLEGRYGDDWRKAAILLRQIAVLKGEANRTQVMDIILDPRALGHWKSLTPKLSQFQKALLDAGKRNTWEAIRANIKRDGKYPMLPSYEQMTKRDNAMTAKERANKATDALKRYIQFLTSQNIASVRRPVLSLPSVSPSIVLFVGMQASCHATCADLARDVLYALYDICQYEYDNCREHSSRAVCKEKWDWCIEDAQDTYYDWYDHCAESC